MINNMMKRLKLNSIQCLACNKILVSDKVHEYQTCGCANKTFIDGGLLYNRCGGKDTELIKCLCEWEDKNENMTIKEKRKYRIFEAI